MKKFYRWMIILIGIFPFSVWALSLDCPEVAGPGEDIECQIQESEMIGLKAKYQTDSVFTYLGFQGVEIWKQYYVGGKGFAIGNIQGAEDFQGVVSFRVGNEAVVGSEYSIKLSEIEGVNESDQNVSLEDVSDKVRIASDVNTLSHLEIVNEKISPKFSSSVLEYQSIVKVDTIEIRASLSDSRATLEGDVGVQSLKYGVNVFKIRVVSERGNAREYKLLVTRVPKNKDATLKSLKINGKEVELKEDTFYYDFNVENEVISLEIEAVSNQALSQIEIEKPEELVIGNNMVSIHVIAEDGTKCTYVVNVLREKLLSGNYFIKSLVIKGYDLEFSKDNYSYELVIEDEDKLEIEVVLEDEFASYVVKGNRNLKNDSKIEIIVKAENGDQRTYTIHIVREGEPNSNSIFSSIRLVPLIGFIVLIVLILIIKRIRRRFFKMNQ